MYGLLFAAVDLSFVKLLIINHIVQIINQIGYIILHTLKLSFQMLNIIFNEGYI